MLHAAVAAVSAKVCVATVAAAVAVAVAAVSVKVSLCSVCSVCSALRACGAYNPTELKRLQHGQKIPNMLENQVQKQNAAHANVSTWFLKTKLCNFLAFSKAKILPFPRLWKALESGYLLQAVCV